MFGQAAKQLVDRMFGQVAKQLVDRVDGDDVKKFQHPVADRDSQAGASNDANLNETEPMMTNSNEQIDSCQDRDVKLSVQSRNAKSMMMNLNVQNNSHNDRYETLSTKGK